MQSFLNLWGPSADAHAAVAILLDSAIKGAGILLLAGVITAGLRRGSAAVRHLVWALSLLSLGLLPVLSATVPHWRLSVLPRSMSGAATSAGPRQPVRPDPFRVELAPEQILAADGVRVATSTAGPVQANRAGATGDWTESTMLAWCAGAAVVIAQLVISLVGIWHKGGRAVPVTDGDWIALANELARQYGIRRHVSLRLASEGVIPATWGFWRPVVLLPLDALDWPQERIRAVLLHELAHVARGDFLVQTLAQIVSVLHWFNPLVWHAGRCLRRESERASDDLVIGAGLRPSSYANQLVEVLMAARREREAPMGVLTMARRGELEDRVRAILDGERPRGLSSRTVALMASAAVCFLFALGFVRLEAKAHDAPKLERLPEGMTIEVVAVSTHPSGKETWWRPDGTPLSTPPCDPADKTIETAGKEVREIVVRIMGLPQGAALSWHTESTSNVLQKDGVPAPDLQRCVAEFEKEMDRCVVHFFLSSGEWVTEQVRDGRGMGIETRDRVFFFGEARETRRGTARVVAHNIMDRDVRLVAIDQEGREHFTGSASSGSKQLKMIDVEFDLPPAQIREYRLQSRPLSRFEIGNVALYPHKVQEHRILTLTRVYWPSSPDAPAMVKEAKGLAANPSVNFVIAHIDEWLAGEPYTQYRVFMQSAAKEVLFQAEGQADVRGHFAGTITQESDVHEMVIAISPDEFAKMKPGVDYTLVPQNGTARNQWKTKGRVVVKRESSP